MKTVIVFSVGKTGTTSMCQSLVERFPRVIHTHCFHVFKVYEKMNSEMYSYLSTLHPGLMHEVQDLELPPSYVQYGFKFEKSVKSTLLTDFCDEITVVGSLRKSLDRIISVFFEVLSINSYNGAIRFHGKGTDSIKLSSRGEILNDRRNMLQILDVYGKNNKGFAFKCLEKRCNNFKITVDYLVRVFEDAYLKRPSSNTYTEYFERLENLMGISVDPDEIKECKSYEGNLNGKRVRVVLMKMQYIEDCFKKEFGHSLDNVVRNMMTNKYIFDCDPCETKRRIICEYKGRLCHDKHSKENYWVTRLGL